MKMNVRGLVFVGFAAAVFASGAWAEGDDPSTPSTPSTPTNIPNGQTAKTTVTSKNYVDAKFQAKEKRVELTGNQTYNDLDSEIKTSNEHYPSMKVLSSLESVTGDFQPKLPTGGKPSLGTYDANGVQLWKEATGGTYVAVSEPSGGTSINFDVNSGAIADTGTKIGDAGASGATSAVQGKLTTAKAVYEYINGTGPGNDNGFQRKLNTSEVNALKVGYKSSTPGENPGDDPTYGDSTWVTLQAKANVAPSSNDDGVLGYLEFTQNGTAWEAGIKSAAIADATDISNATADNPYSTRQKLTTAQAVYDFAVQKHWGSGHPNKNLVTDANGDVVLSEVPAMPEFGQNDVCKNENVNCALVTTWVPADPLTNVEAHMELHWTVMADNTDTVTNP